MSTLSLLLAGSLAFAEAPDAPGETPFDRLTFNGCTVNEGCARLAALSGLSVSVSAKASNSLLILNVSNIKASDALQAMVRAAGLSWQFDEKTGVYHVMTAEEYRAGLSLTDSPEIRSFKVNPANLATIAEAISALYVERAQLSYGSRPRDFSKESVETIQGLNNDDNGNGSNNGSNNGGKNGGNNGSNNPAGNIRMPTEAERLQELRLRELIAQAEDRAVARQASGSTEHKEIEKGAPERLRDAAAKSRLSSIVNPIYITIIQEQSLLLVRTADVKSLEDITKLVERVDKPVPQVLLEMKILKLKLSDGFISAFDYDIGIGGQRTQTPGGRNLNPLTPSSATGREHLGGLGNAVAESSPTLVYQYLDDNLRARIQLMAANNKVETLATPLLVATNNRAAQITVGEERVITTGATVRRTEGTSNTPPSDLISYDSEIRSIGTVLKLIPYINDDDSLSLYVEQENSSLAPKSNTLLVPDADGGTVSIQVDAVDTAKISATVNAKNNLAVAVGGLIRNEKTSSIQKVPWLGDIPYLGWFFRREAHTTEKTELVLIITPRIIRSGEEGQAISQARAAELSNHGWHSFGQAGLDVQNGRVAKYQEEIKEVQKKLKEDAEKAVKPDAAP